MRRILNISCLAIIAALCWSCDRQLETAGAEAFSLKGVYESSETRSMPFTQGDEYHIFAYESARETAGDLATPYIDSPATENSGKIEFPSGSDVKTLFGGLTLNFYGVTLGEPGSIEDALSRRTIGGVADKPVFTLQRTDGHLKDLRRARLEGLNSKNSGEITLPFKHALSKIVFTITRQDVAQLVDAKLEYISIWDYESASYDILAGEWVDTTGCTRTEMEVFSSSVGRPIYTDEELHEHPGGDVVESCLVFPRTAGSGRLHVKACVRVPNSDFGAVISNDHLLEVESDLELADIPGGLGMRQNHEYRFSLAVVNNNIKIIMVVPTMFDWIKGETGYDEDITLGHPITFGGVTWADRNVGAESATYRDVQEWDRMRGYFFQYGRSVPLFVMPTNKKTIGGRELEYSFTPQYSASSANTYNPYLSGFPLINNTSIKDAREAVRSFAGAENYPGGIWKTAVTGSTSYYYTGHWTGRGQQYPLGYYSSASTATGLACLPNEWERLGEWQDINNSEKKRYLVVKGGASDSEPWWTGTTGSVSAAPDTWYDPATSPCPKGWKVPSRDDWAGIMPLSKRTGDITFNYKSGGSAYNSDAGLNSYYDYTDESGSVKHQFICLSDANITYVYHNKTYASYWRKTPYFNAGYEKIDPDDTEPRLWWHEVGGVFAINYTNLKEDLGDPSPGYISHYLCIENKHDPNAYDNVKSKLTSSQFEQGTLYAIKCQGSDQAYRLRWRYLILTGDGYAPVAYYNGDKYPVILEISRYPASSEDVLECPDDLKKWDDWDYPSETMVFPIGGYLYSDGPVMTNNALESVYAASDHDADGWFYYVRLKHSTSQASRYLMLFRMRRSYGMSVRCVKDNTVNIE